MPGTGRLVPVVHHDPGLHGPTSAMIRPMERGLSYVVHGAGEPLLLVHGTGSNLRVWDPIVRRLAADRTVVAVDLPGFGLSPRLSELGALPEVPSDTQPTPAGFALVLAALIRRLDHDTVHVAGNSVGGWTALEMAKLGVARSVVALSPAGLWRREAPLYDVLSLRNTRRFTRLFDPLLPALLSRPLGRSIALYQTFAHPERIPPRAAVEAARAFGRAPGFDEHFEATIRERFAGGRSISVPVTVAFGARDRLLLRHQSRHRDELPPRTRWFELPDCGHIPTHDDPTLVAEVILDGSSRRD